MEVRTQTFATPRLDLRAQKELSQIIEERRATSHFTSEPVPEEDIVKILHYAGQAPSGYNFQPWRIIVVRDEANRRRLQKAAYDQEKISEAPVVLIFLGMKEETKKWASDVFYEGVRRGLGHIERVEENIKEAIEFISSVGMPVWVNRHTMIAFSFAMLMAEALGYDTAPMEGFEPEKVKKEFGIPDEGEVIALLAIGHLKPPDKLYGARFPLSRIVFAEKYGAPWKEKSNDIKISGLPPHVGS